VSCPSVPKLVLVRLEPFWQQPAPDENSTEVTGRHAGSAQHEAGALRCLPEQRRANMVRKIVLAFVGLGAAGVVAISLLTIPLLRRLPKPSRVSMDGITTIEDAVEACRRTHLHGWDLVAYAQNLAARKFTYSRLNTWETPSRAFERGMGYCEQQALALKHIYDRLGIEARPVFALRCKFPARVVDGMPSPEGVSGHAWLRVRIGDEELDVCSDSVNNKPGVTHFEILSKVHTWQPWLRPLTHLGSSIENIRRDMMARRGIKGAARSPIDTREHLGASAQPA
jgi:hypothetical protein